MRRFVFSTSVYGMTISRKDAVERVEALKKPIAEHLCKCAIYGDDLECLDHWIKELASFFDVANRCVLKNGKKLSSRQYSELLFSGFGDSATDAENALRFFAALYMGKEYPKVALTLDIADTLFYIVSELKKTLCPMLASSNNCTTVEFKNIIYDILYDAGI